MTYSPQFGDVINTRPEEHGRLWKILHPWQSIPTWGIQRHQRERGFAEWRDTHSMLYLGPERILSVTWPRAKWETWPEVSRRLWTAYRPTFALSQENRASMLTAAAQLIGTHYDAGQLLSIALSRILHYPPESYNKWFDAGARQMVCSVGVRACFERARKDDERYGLKPPFAVLFQVGGRKLNVERTTPADFAGWSGMFARVGGCDDATA